MVIESVGSNVEVLEKVELDIVVQAGEGGPLNAVRVELGLAGMGKSSISRVERPSRVSEMEEIGRGNASKMKA